MQTDFRQLETTQTETKNGNEKQCFLTAKLRFNLRQKSDMSKPTIIYAVVFKNGCKHVLNTSVKVFPIQWSCKKQQAIISNEFSNLDNRNNLIANNRLKAIRCRFDEVVSEIGDNPDRINEFISIFAEKLNLKRMRKQRGLKFTTELSQLNISEIGVGDARRNARDTALKAYVNFIKAKSIEDCATAVTYQNWELFKQYLLTIKKNGKRYAWRTLSEYCNSMKSLFKLYNDSKQDSIIPVHMLKAMKQQTALNTEQKQSKNVIISESEINRLYRVKLSDSKQQTAKDLFLFQCSIGCRVSDLQKIVKGDFELKEVDGITYINYQSKKTNTNTFTPLFTYTAKDLFKWVQTLSKFPLSESQYNRYLKMAFKGMGYDEEITITESRGGEIVTTQKQKW